MNSPEIELEPYKDGPVTLEERLGTQPDTDSMAALAIARRWPEKVAWRDLEPWQRIGPELLYAAAQQFDGDRPAILRETVTYLEGIGWVKKRKFSLVQMVMAANDAVDRLMYRRCTNALTSSLAVALSHRAFLDLRAEAVAFQHACLVRYASSYLHARHAE